MTHAATPPPSLAEDQARTIIAPWYALFNLPVQGDMKSLQEQILTEDYQSRTGDGAQEVWGRNISIKVVGSFAQLIPDMSFEIKEVLVAGDRVLVRGEVTGTPALDLYGGLIPHTGKSFRIMALDLHTLRDGKIAKTYHMENWFAALTQLRAG